MAPPHESYAMDTAFLPRQKNFLHNPLLVHPVLGRARRPTCKLPPPETTFGCHGDRDALTAGKLISEWKSHVPNPSSLPGSDFVRFNIASADHGAITSQQITQFRRTHEYRIRIAAGNANAKKPSVPSHLRDITFGKPCSRDPEEVSFASIIENAAHKTWLEGQRHKAMQRNLSIRGKSTKHSKPKTTRSEQLRCESRKAAEELQRSRSEALLWKSHRYDEVPARVPIPFSPSRQRYQESHGPGGDTVAPVPGAH
ncbi:Cilia- and flagella-associated protein 77 [Plasmodiophora brassicae]